MTKTDFIERMALKANINKTQAKKITHLFLDTLYECLKESGRVKFYGFGIFEVKTTKKKIGRNPKTKEEIDKFIEVSKKGSEYLDAYFR